MRYREFQQSSPGLRWLSKVQVYTSITMKKLFYILPVAILLAAGCSAKKPATNTPPAGQGQVACTQEAMLCPDGSAVGRTGPDCAFAPCPTATTIPKPKPAPTPAPTPNPTPISLNSGIQGTITTGPTCPVQRIPPDPSCANKPLQATASVQTADGAKTVTSFTSALDGTFKVTLQPGTYLIHVTDSPHLSYPMAAANAQQIVTVEANKFTTVDLVIDTGIR